ncbi:hypothetical protein CH330_01385 [candidate division WOR-3 bacterium JGI_Cruoil_03_51_56]|uniref:Uncharacterized protein n=1 Tax=candidate division WOR-3 bacterium JGI_Cruoil_03_51_56 TaxID=1973747 RepID=A0A235BXS2_UNCW3|nr:MAG: hypothetical protein CH330_01385 [candidate division WOR-3 bacterium JGI_Cruoil_03_51_56]
MGSWTNRWILEGDFISFWDENLERFFFVRRRDFAHIAWEFGWPEVDVADRNIAPGQVGGPYVSQAIKPTLWTEKTVGGKPRARGQIFQWIAGIKPNVKWYIQLPTDRKRHGTPKLPWPSKRIRTVAHFTMQMSPFDRPTFFTEHFLVPKLCDLAGIEVYNGLDITVTPHFNFYINKLDVELVGQVDYTEDGVVLEPSYDRYTEVLNNLYKKVARYRPLTLFPVTSPASER